MVAVVVQAVSVVLRAALVVVAGEPPLFEQSHCHWGAVSRMWGCCLGQWPLAPSFGERSDSLA